jgi:hypothetical protein
MSARKTIALVAILVLAALNTACASSGDRYYDPSSGVRMPVVLSGVCYPGQKEKGQTCVCQKEGANYKNCAFQVVAAAPIKSYFWTPSECFAALQTNQLFNYGACMRGEMSLQDPRTVIFGVQPYGYTQSQFGYQQPVQPNQQLAPGIYFRNGKQCQVPYVCPDTGHPRCRIDPC